MSANMSIEYRVIVLTDTWPRGAKIMQLRSINIREAQVHNKILYGEAPPQGLTPRYPLKVMFHYMPCL